MNQLVAILFAFLSPLILLIAARKLSTSFAASPLSLIAVQVIVGITIKTVLLAGNENANSLLVWGYEPSFLADASVYIFIFCLLTIVGYGLAYKPRQMVQARQANGHLRLSDRSIRILIFFVTIVSTLIFILLSLQKENFTSLGNIFDNDQFSLLQRRRVQRIEGVEGYGNTFFATTVFFNANLLVFIIATVALYWRTGIADASRHLSKNKIRLLIIVCCCFLVLEVLVTGKRNLLALYILSYTAIVFSSGANFSFKQLVAYICGFMLVFWIFSILTIARQGGLGGGIETVWQTIMRPMFYSEYFLSISKLTVIMSQVTADTILWGKSLVSWVLGVIPRPLWPEKPPVSLGPYVKSEIYGARGTIGGIPPTFPGELYINFMWFGLLLAPVYGLFLRIFENACLNPRNIVKYGSHYIYFLVLPGLTYGLIQNALSGQVINLGARVFIAYLVLFFVLRWKKNIAPRLR